MTTVIPSAAAQKQWFENRDHSFTIGSQTGEIRLNAKFQVYVYRTEQSGPAQKFVLVSLEGTTVRPTQAGMEKDEDDIRGWFTENVQVGMGFDDAQPDELVLRQDSPDTTTQTGSVSSSVSLNFNAGFFGETPTAGAGLSISNSFTASLSDFAVNNRSTNAVVAHEMKLAMTAAGHPYAHPNDLVDMSAGGQFTGGPLFNLPDRAVTNLPVISQALFWAPHPLDADRTLRVTLTVRLRKVEKTFKFFTVDVQDWSHVEAPSWTFTIPFAEVN